MSIHTLSVRQSTYRHVPGYSVVGSPPQGGRVKIWCHRETTARAIVADLKGNGGRNVDMLLRLDALEPCKDWR